MKVIREGSIQGGTENAGKGRCAEDYLSRWIKKHENE